MFCSAKELCARLTTSSLCDAPRKCERACKFELNSRLQTSHRCFSWFTGRVLVERCGCIMFARGADAVVLVTVCESMMNWPRWLNEQFWSNDWNTANKIAMYVLISISQLINNSSELQHRSMGNRKCIQPLTNHDPITPNTSTFGDKAYHWWQLKTGQLTKYQ